MKFDQKEKAALANRLSKHSMFFRTIHDLSEIVFNENTQAAAQVLFTKDDHLPVRIEINPTIWAELNSEEKPFLVAHECLHVIFSHPKRFRDFLKTEKWNGKGPKPKDNSRAWNMGVDVSINEMLVRQFGFDSSKFRHPIILGGCWLDTIWPDEQVPDRKSSDYYIQKIIQDGKAEQPEGSGGKGQGGVEMLDDHSGFGAEGDEQGQEALDGMIGEGEAQNFLRELSGEQHKEVKEGEPESQSKHAGKGSGNWRDIQVPRPPKKRKWEKVIAHWVRKAQQEKIDLFERWEAGGGRYSMIQNEDTKLPFEKWMIDDNHEKCKVNLLFFLDTSGSCISYGERFLKAARTIPTDRFNVHLACFDTRVFPTNLKDNQIYGGGGTTFTILEEYALSLPVYPDAIFVISDGYGNNLTCKYPKRWHWFMTPHYSASYIPAGSKIYKLEDYE